MSPQKPGTALVWREDLPIQFTREVVPRRVQVLRLDGVAVVNVYAPSGSSCKEEREELFSGELALALRGLGREIDVIAAGDWNCVLRPRDVERDFQSKFSLALSGLVKGFKFKAIS